MSSMLHEFGAGLTAFEAPLDARLAFIRRTYLHVTGAAIAFVAISAVLQTSGFAEGFARWAFNGRMTWLAVIGGFALLGWMSRAFARADRSPAVQYGGLGLYVLAEAVIFSPMIFLASRLGSHVLATAAGLTVLAFGALTTYVLATKRDFSFLRPFLIVACLLAFAAIIAMAFFPQIDGIWFSVAMIVVAIGCILYTTSNVLHQYRTDQHVAASIEVFAAVALLFWYVLRLVMQLQRR